MQSETMKSLADRISSLRRERAENRAAVVRRAEEILDTARRTRDATAAEEAERLAQAMEHLRQLGLHADEIAEQGREARREAAAARGSSVTARLAEEREQIRLSRLYWTESGGGAG